MDRDVRIVRGLGKVRRPRTALQVASKRGRIAAFSGQARARFLWHVRNLPALTFALTLTYAGQPPMDDVVTKRHIKAMKRWLIKQGLGVVWKQEFGTKGRPHFHLMTTGPIDAKVAAAKWARIVGCEVTPHLVHGEAIRDRTALEWYCAKRRLSGSNRVPAGYENMGRWWGYGGPGTEVVPLLTIEGPEADVADVVRVVKKAQERKVGGKGKRDNGITSRKLYGGGGNGMADGAARYAESMGMEVVRKPADDAEGEP